MKQTIKSLLAGLVLALCMPLTAAADDIPIDEEHFPDANFRSWLTRDSYGVDKILTDAEIQKITSIHVPSGSIQDLTGIKYFTALTSLYCGSNQLTSLDVSGCSALTSLNCNSNQLTSLDVSGCSALTSLTCNSNQLTSLDVSGCSALTSLNCNLNQLTDLDVSGCPMLSILWCSSNQLTDLDVSGCPMLSSLSCSNNQLTALDCRGLKNLTILNCSSNKIRYLDVSDLYVVASDSPQTLHCYDNQLNGIYMSAFISTIPGMKEIDRNSTFPHANINIWISGDANAYNSEQYQAIKAKSSYWDILYLPSGFSIWQPAPSSTTTDIPEIEVSVDANGLATYCPFVGIDFTNATKIAAYRATLEGNTVKLTRVYQVRLGEGVLLRSLDGGAATESLPGLLKHPNEAENAFKGIRIYEKDIMVQETDDNVTNFVLSKKNGVIGFYKAKPEGTKVAAGKAYLPVENYDPTTAEVGLRVEFEDGEALGIDGVETQKAEQDDATYTLSGIRIDRPTAKGIYIRNGKKIVIQ